MSTLNNGNDNRNQVRNAGGETECILFNPKQPEFRANPYPTYHRLRTQDAIHYRPSQRDFLLTRYTDIASVLKDTRFGFLDVMANRPDSTPTWEQLTELETNGKKFLQLRRKSRDLTNLWLGVRNPPEHTRLRKLVHSAFTSQIVLGLRPRIQAIADVLIDQVSQAGAMDVIADFAYPLPILVISEILGIPVEDYRLFRPWSRDLERALHCVDDIPLTQERGLMAIMGFTEYLRKRVAKQQEYPQDGLISTLVQAYRQGKLSMDELLANGTLLLFAGHNTTQHLIGNGVLALLRHPDQLRRLRENPILIGPAIEELLRYDSPSQAVSRIAFTDTRINGQTIWKGQKVWLVLGAANRDAAQFPEPDKLDITRQPNLHLAFGQGIHYCLGRNLVRLEAEIAIGTLIRRLPRLALHAVDLEWEESFGVHGLKALPVIF